MKRRFLIISLLLAAVIVMTSCGSTNEAKKNTTENIAPDSDVIEVTALLEDGVQPVASDNIEAGTYDITAETDSAMFAVTACKLYADSEGLTADITVDGNKYPYICLKSLEDTVASDGSDYIEAVDNGDGTSTYSIAIDALDKSYDLATYSSKKEMWYGRHIVLRADSLPLEAYKDAPFNTVASLGIEDGTYSIDAELGGGSGRATIDTPLELTVADGKSTARIVWSSPYYDYMIVKGQRFEPVNKDGNSTFDIPVEAFDYRTVMVADTTAMSKPHEITYSLTLKSDSIVQQ